MAAPLIEEDEYHQHCDNSDGYCTACNTWTTGGVEPDAEGYLCEACGENAVMGAEDAVMMGMVLVDWA